MLESKKDKRDIETMESMCVCVRVHSASLFLSFVGRRRNKVGGWWLCFVLLFRWSLHDCHNYDYYAK